MLKKLKQKYKLWKETVFYKRLSQKNTDLKNKYVEKGK